MLQLQQVAFWSFFQPCKWFFFFVFACDLLKIWIQTWIHVSCWPEASYKCKLCDKCETNEKDMSLLKWLFMRSSLLISYKSMKGSITLSNRLMAYLNVCWGVCVKLWPTKGRRVGRVYFELEGSQYYPNLELLCTIPPCGFCSIHLKSYLNLFIYLFIYFGDLGLSWSFQTWLQCKATSHAVYIYFKKNVYQKKLI